MEKIRLGTVEETVKNKLCVSCGACESVCPVGCIEMKRKEGQYLPKLSEECILCKACLKVCSGWEVDYKELYKFKGMSIPSDYFIGNYLSVEMAYAKENELRKSSVSGGMITLVISELLNAKKYQVAFVLKDNKLDEEVKLKGIFEAKDLKGTPKSRYIPVSINNFLNYVVKNPDKKVVVVGTSCHFHSILKFLKYKNISDENILFLGLFCDRTLNNNVIDYFGYNYGKKDEKISEFYYRTKEKSGWPGNIKIVFDNIREEHLKNTKRMEIKDYFQLNRCLYCIDKLNQFADISFGDHYVKGEETNLGANSVIVRSEKGRKVFNGIRKLVVVKESNIEEIKESQKLEIRKNNLDFSNNLYHDKGIDLYPCFEKKEVNKNKKQILKDKNKKINIGINYLEDKDLILEVLTKEKKNKKIKKILALPYRVVKKILSCVSGGKK